MTKLRRWTVVLMAVLVVPVGPGVIAAGHAALDHHHDHDRDAEAHRAWQAVIHGHAHEDGVPPHDHDVLPGAEGLAARAAFAGGSRNVSPVAGMAATATGVFESSRFSSLIEARGAGPPSPSHRSTVLRI